MAPGPSEARTLMNEMALEDRTCRGLLHCWLRTPRGLGGALLRTYDCSMSYHDTSSSAQAVLGRDQRTVDVCEGKDRGAADVRKANLRMKNWRSQMPQQAQQTQGGGGVSCENVRKANSSYE